MKELIIRKATLDDINTIGYLAYLIWPATYQGLLEFDRLHYMLNLNYSPDSLRKQMTTDGHQFLIAELDNKAVGFASYSRVEDPSVFKLHKLYVQTTIQGKGLGSALLEKVKDNCKSEQGTLLRLNVKRDNNAVTFYKKQGFEIICEEDIDIGNGYFMHDYRMEMPL